MKNIYVDHAATTKIKKEVLEYMMPYLTTKYGNPSAGYILGNETKKAIEEAREKVCKAIGAENKEEIYFTSGGTESDNLAIKGIAHARKNRGKHIITSKIEHKAILNSCKQLEKEGFEITYLNVDSDGLINLREFEESIRDDTILISIMFANNEIGTIEPIGDIGKIAKKYHIPFHVDAVQAIGSVKINVQDLNIDLLSLSAHKFYGPKGVGALYIRNGIEVKKIIDGGGQEKKMRAGTENVAGIVGLGKAIEIANENVENYSKKLCYLRDYYIGEVQRKIPFTKLNGHINKRLPGNANISFKGVKNSTLILLLTEKGIFCSGGSACNTKNKEPSHVLSALGMSKEISETAIRITFGEENNLDDVRYIVRQMKELVDSVRQN